MKLVLRALFPAIAATFAMSAVAESATCQTVTPLPHSFEALFSKRSPRGNAVLDGGFYLPAERTTVAGKLGPAHMLAKFSTAKAALDAFEALVSTAKASGAEMVIDESWSTYPGRNGPRSIAVQSYRFCVSGRPEPMQVIITESLEDNSQAGDRRFFVGVQLL